VSFLVAAALLMGLLVAAPVAAHLFRRGRAKEQEFPPAKLVPIADRSAKTRSRLEDRWLLLVRSAAILVLSVIAAIPFVRCDRLALDRSAGASVALAIVLDDSLSMRTVTEGDGSRFSQALQAARELVASTREGDAVGIVLAGKPARLALAATTDLGTVRETLKKLEVQDTATDLDTALKLAESTLKSLPHVDKRVFALSDFADDKFRLRDDKSLLAPLDQLRKPSQNCGIVQAQRLHRRAIVQVACNSAAAAQGRQVSIVAAKGLQPNVKGEVITKTALSPQTGTQVLDLSIPDGSADLDALLTGSDNLKEDDYAPVARAQQALLIGVVADTANAAAQGGTSTVIEQALGALTASAFNDQPAEIRPLPLIPEDAKELSRYSALIIDDPPGLTPEARNALAAWLRSGGFAAAFLGPNVEAAQLGSSFEPFARGALTWEASKASGLKEAREFLGEAGNSLSDLGAKNRLRMPAARQEGEDVLLRWDDGAPWMLKRRLGRGQTWTFGLPVSVDRSDLALRPGFLALLERFVFDAAQNSGQRVTEAGTTWRLRDSASSVNGPQGSVPVPPDSQSDNLTGAWASVTPTLRGRYQVVDSKQDAHERVVTINEQEVIAQPQQVPPRAAPTATAARAPNIEVSKQFAWLLLALLGVDLALRLASRIRLSRQNPA
jgi:hypothetical protein